MTLEIAALTWVTPFLLLLLYSIITDGPFISGLLLAISYRFKKETFYKVSIDGNSFIGSMKQAEIEYDEAIKAGANHHDMCFSIVKMTRHQLDKLPEFDGF